MLSDVEISYLFSLSLIRFRLLPGVPLLRARVKGLGGGWVGLNYKRHFSVKREKMNMNVGPNSMKDISLNLENVTLSSASY